MKSYLINLTDLSECEKLDSAFFESFDEGLSEIYINPHDVDALYPCPWDASFSIDGDSLIIKGYVYMEGYGDAVVTIPKTDGCKIYNIQLFLENIEDLDSFLKIIDSYRIKYDVLESESDD